MPPLLCAFLAAAAPAKDPELVTRSVQLFAITASLLSAFLLSVVVLGYLRHRRLHPRSTVRVVDSLELPDAWAEAGRRVEPGDEGRGGARGGSRGGSDGGGKGRPPAGSDDPDQGAAP